MKRITNRGRMIRILLLSAILMAGIGGAAFAADQPTITVEKGAQAGIYNISYEGRSSDRGKLMNVFAYKGEYASEKDGKSIKNENFLDGETAVIGNDGKFTVDLRFNSKEGAVIYLGAEDNLLPKGTSPYLVPVNIYATPKSLKAATAGYDSVRLTWEKVSGAKQYRIFRGSSESGIDKTKPIAAVSQNSYIDTGLTTDQSYYYAVQACDEKMSSDFSNTASAAPKLTSTECSVNYGKRTYDQVVLAWSKVNGASGYYIYRTANAGSWPAKPSINVTGGNTLTFTDSAQPTGTTIYYRIQAYRTLGNGKIAVSALSTQKTIKPYLKTTKLKSIKTKKKTITLKWAKVDGASGYYIYRSLKKKKGFKKVAVVKGVKKITYTNKKLKAKTKYFYKIRPYRVVNGKTVFAAYSNVKYIKTKKK